MLPIGNLAPRTPAVARRSRQLRARPSPLQAVPGALGGCQAITFRRTATELPARHPDLLNTP
jgi:hypothetical protein